MQTRNRNPGIARQANRWNDRHAVKHFKVDPCQIGQTEEAKQQPTSYNNIALAEFPSEKGYTCSRNKAGSSQK